MSGGNKQGGYTIVEVMMFLAISGSLFVVAMLAIGGKQSQAQFAQGIRDLQSRIEDVVNDVSTGYFPDVGTYSCVASDPSTGAPITFAAGIASQGENEDCIFLGKVFHFTQNSSKVSLINVGGRRATDQGLPVSTLQQAHPIAINGCAPAWCPDMTETFNLDGGLVVTKLITKVGSNPPDLNAAAIGIFSSLPLQSVNSTSGAIATNTWTIPLSSMLTDSDPLATGDRVNNMTMSGTPQLNPVIAICLQHGVGGKSAAILVGARGRQPYAEVHIDDVVSAVNTAVGSTCP